MRADTHHNNNQDLIKWAVMEMQKVRIGMDGKYSDFDAIAFDANNPEMNLTGWKMNNNAENWAFCKRIVNCEQMNIQFESAVKSGNKIV